MIDRLLDLSVGDSVTIDEDDGESHHITIRRKTNANPDPDASGKVYLKGRCEAGYEWAVTVFYQFDGIESRSVTGRVVRRARSVTAGSAWHDVGGEIRV